MHQSGRWIGHDYASVRGNRDAARFYQYMVQIGWASDHIDRVIERR
jgi:hypothetical protein